MIHIIKILLFIIVNVGGYYTIPIMGNVSAMLGVFPDMATYEEVQELKHWLFGIGTWVWLGAAAVSIGYFFAAEKIRVWLILAPLYVPFIYGSTVMIYFSFFRPQVS